MTIKEIKEKVKTSKEYDFLRTDKRIKDKLILVGLGGSYAYGTNNEESDVDIRGIAHNSELEIFTGQDFEQVVNNETDTTIYSLNKMIYLLKQCNPNTIEILGLKPEHYIYRTEIGNILLNNKHLFLSKQAVKTFGGYAYAQLRRLDNKSARTLNDKEHEEHVLHSIQNAMQSFAGKYFHYDEDSIRLYVDKSNKEDISHEIFMNLNLRDYPLKDFNGMMNEITNILRDYEKLGHRNKNAIARNKLGKHMCHLCRLMFMCIDILDKHEIITYREAEHDLLMAIRNGEYLDSEGHPTEEFNNLVSNLQEKMTYSAEHTTLPDKPDYEKIMALQYMLNKAVVEKANR